MLETKTMGNEAIGAVMVGAVAQKGSKQKRYLLCYAKLHKTPKSS